MADDEDFSGPRVDDSKFSPAAEADEQSAAESADAIALNSKKAGSPNVISTPKYKKPDETAEHYRLLAEIQTAEIKGDMDLFLDAKLAIKEVLNTQIDLGLTKLPSIKNFLDPTSALFREIFEILILDDAPPLVIAMAFFDGLTQKEKISELKIPYTAEQLVKMHGTSDKVMKALSPKAQDGYKDAMDRYAKTLASSISAQTGLQGNHLKVAIAPLSVGLSAELSKNKYQVSKDGIVSEKPPMGLGFIGVKGEPILDLQSSKDIARFANEKLPALGIKPEIAEKMPGRNAPRQRQTPPPPAAGKTPTKTINQKAPSTAKEDNTPTGTSSAYEKAKAKQAKKPVIASEATQNAPPSNKNQGHETPPFVKDIIEKGPRKNKGGYAQVEAAKGEGVDLTNAQKIREQEKASTEKETTLA